MKKKFPIVSFILYICYGLLLTVCISLGAIVLNKVKEIYFNVSQDIKDYKEEVIIEDLVLSLDLTETFVIEKDYSFPYTLKGKNTDNAQLVFEALDETIIVNEDGSFKGVRTNSISTTGRIKVTSQTDLDFEEIYEVKFEKRYPQSFELHSKMKSSDKDSSTVYVGMPIYLTNTITSSTPYSESDYTLEYDSNYFTLLSDMTLLAIKETSSTIVKYVYGNNTYASKEFCIASNLSNDFNLVTFSDIDPETKNLVPGKKYDIRLLKDESEVYYDYNISSSLDSIKTDKYGFITFTNPGKYDLTFKLPNGFEKNVSVNVENIVSYPTFDKLNTQDALYIKLDTEEVISYSFASNTTYKNLQFIYDENQLSITTSNNTITIVGKTVGEASVKIIVDDGMYHYQEEYKIVIEEVKVSAFKLFMDEAKTKFMAFARRHVYKLREITNEKITNTKIYLKEHIKLEKVGHMLGFLVLALFSFILFYNSKIKKSILLVVLYIGSGLIFAILTEILQLYLPGRNCSYIDVIIDMSGFFIGTIIFSLAYKGINTLFYVNKEVDLNKNLD